MAKADTDFDSVSFPGSLKAGLYTAQLGVALTVSRQSITLSSSGRSFCIDRPHLIGLSETSILGLFKRGIRFHHRQPGIPENIVFYPSASRDHLRQAMKTLGWP